MNRNLRIFTYTQIGNTYLMVPSHSAFLPCPILVTYIITFGLLSFISHKSISLPCLLYCQVRFSFLSASLNKITRKNTLLHLILCHSTKTEPQLLASILICLLKCYVNTYNRELFLILYCESFENRFLFIIHSNLINNDVS